MKTKYWNCFFIWQFGREEQWLNEMSQKGLHLKKVNGPFDLFSDIDSRIKHLERVRTLLLILVILVILEAFFVVMQLGAIERAGIWYGAVLLGVLEVCLLGGLYKLQQQLNRLRRERQLHE